MELISDETDKHGQRFRRWLVSRKETEDVVTERHKYVNDYPNGEHYEGYKTFKQQKFLCVNGSEEGTKMTWEKASKLGYLQYNLGERKAGFPRCVLIQF
jgi:hypothetical protein